MRLLALGLLVAFGSPVRAADKDEEKAKEVVSAFLKAVVAKDVDAAMKTVDVPFTFEVGSSRAVTVNKTDELKGRLDKMIKNADSDLVKDFKVVKAYDMKGIAKYAADAGGEDEGKKFAETAEKLVGKSGYMVVISGKEGKEVPVLIRFKDGKALIASLPK